MAQNGLPLARSSATVPLLKRAVAWLNHHDSRPWTVIAATHCLGVYAAYVLVTAFDWWMVPAIWFMWFLFGGIGVEIGLHRMWSHKALQIKGKLRWFVAWCSVMAIQDTPLFWAILHRTLHHAKTDQPEDLHSPIHGLGHAYMGWMFKSKNLESRMIGVRDLLSDPMHRTLLSHYGKIYWLTIGAAAILLGPALTAVLFVIPSLMALHQENLVNVLCHSPLAGYRNFDINNKSTNVLVLGWLFWGQGFHNNHHARPMRYDFGHKSYEIDICRWLVPALVWADKRIG